MTAPLRTVEQPETAWLTPEQNGPVTWAIAFEGDTIHLGWSVKILAGPDMVPASMEWGEKLAELINDELAEGGCVFRPDDP